MSVIIPCFAYGPFNGRAVNGSSTFLKALEQESFEGFDIKTHYLDVCWGEPEKVLNEIGQNNKFPFALAFGEGNSERIHIEICGQNLMNGIDNDGLEKNNQKIDELSEGTIYSKLNLDLKQIENLTPYPVQISEDAGLFLCNNILFRGLQFFEGRFLFIHIPPQAETNSFNFSNQHLTWVKQFLTQLIQLNTITTD